MWPFRKSPIDDAAALRKAINELSAAHSKLREDHEDLKERFGSLRGRVYAAGIHKNPLQDPDAKLSRDELRRRMGFIPGRPMKHED